MGTANFLVENFRISDAALKEALRSLRVERLKITQTEMAGMIGKSTHSLQRYEGKDALPIDVIVSVAKIAVDSNNNDLADIFTQGLLERLGPHATDVMRHAIDSVGAHEKKRGVADANLIVALLEKIPENVCLSDEQRELMDLLLRVLDSGKTERITALREILKALLV